MTGPARVLLVDDQVLMRQGLAKLLEIEDAVDVVGEAADGVEALEVLAGAAGTGAYPDVALVDARMPRMDGVELVARMAREHPAVAPVVLTTFDDDAFIFGGLRAGAKGYLLKDTPPDELVSAVLRAARGETVLGGAAAERLVAGLRSAPPEAGGAPEPDGGAPLGDRPVGEGLSEREAEVARLVGGGATNRQIARRLFITEGTVKNHVSSILRKLGLRDRTQLAVWVGRSGLAP
ncbi:response regulator transcription factor [Nocardiopsis sp. RSe5-2]|uniref:Response regulator transcription factor n=1 Tax=Nocardiopsis endophytica TaxID=3018445 RepID=A0ABT4UB84_9ACTN|nr:response regulator transcription factor [Nocardiopsis endophytica]MDA2814216.1 response regulator transcription factor [Nocardiopsis endophytica]